MRQLINNPRFGKELRIFSYKDISIGLLQGKLELKSRDEYRKVSATPNIEQEPDQRIQPKNTYRQDFNLKAGWSGGLRPRPDTYIISGEVEYRLEDKVYYKQINIEVSIFSFAWKVCLLEH
jgi:hypothetical protein